MVEVNPRKLIIGEVKAREMIALGSKCVEEVKVGDSAAFFIDIEKLALENDEEDTEMFRILGVREKLPKLDRTSFWERSERSLSI